MTTHGLRFRTFVKTQFGVILFGFIALTSTGANAGSREVARADPGEEWPLTINAGTLECGRGLIYTFKADEKTRADSGTADAQGYVDIEPILKDNPENPGAKNGIGQLIDLAKSLRDQ